MTSFVARHAGIEVSDAALHPGLALPDLFDLALRINPKRPHLLVSTVLAKHVPTDPRVVRGSGLLLGLLVAEHLGGGRVDPAAAAELGRVLRTGADPQPFADLVETGGAPPAPGRGLVLGYAETATALGHLVARALGWPSIHSTRRRVPGFAAALGFDEAHSHATEHLVLPRDPGLLTGSGPVVLVDDELSTGRTALNTIRALHRLVPRERYVIAALIDVRTAADRDAMAAVAAELAAPIEVVALASGEVSVPADAGERVADLVALPLGTASETAAPATGRRVWPWRVAETGRHGFGPADDAALDVAARQVADDLDPQLGASVLVLGTEELMYAPLAIADALRRPDRQVRFSSTTRSPVRVLDVQGYPIRSGIAFAAHDNQAEPGERFAYNVVSTGSITEKGGSTTEKGGSRTDGGWSDVVVVVDSAMCTAGLDGLLSALAPYAAQVHLAVLPSAAGLPEGLTGPDFGSYAPDEVTWLLQDLSHVSLEGATETRERAIQAGEAHYAESLPIEYRPEQSYQRLFHEQLAEVAPRVASAVGTVTELAISVRERDDLVLVSLARAGTPIGVLMQRWARQRHGLEWPHYAISIVRDRGIDLTAMRYLAARHDPRRVLFVDGWTGKGAITREFTEAVAAVNDELQLGGRGFDPGLAVLADPGECVSLYGTRDDFLIPSACLNSTVSGLVSRTVLNADLIGPDEFHGAKFYAELAPEDVSALYLDTVTGHLDAVAPAAEACAAELLLADREPTWVGWSAAEHVREAYDLPSINLVKPGVGETTRVLLRRVPWRVVVNPERQADLRHVELLAAERGVPVVSEPGLPYSCIGLIRPTERDGS